MPQLLIKRIVAYGIDLTLIFAYAVLLYLGMDELILNKGVRIPDNPISGLITGFVMLTLPVLIYSYRTEIRSEVGRFFSKAINWNTRFCLLLKARESALLDG